MGSATLLGYHRKVAKNCYFFVVANANNVTNGRGFVPKKSSKSSKKNKTCEYCFYANKITKRVPFELKALVSAAKVLRFAMMTMTDELRTCS